MVDQQNLAAALAGNGGAHQASPARAKDYCVVMAWWLGHQIVENFQISTDFAIATGAGTCAVTREALGTSPRPALDPKNRQARARHLDQSKNPRIASVFRGPWADHVIAIGSICNAASEACCRTRLFGSMIVLPAHRNKSRYGLIPANCLAEQIGFFSRRNLCAPVVFLDDMECQTRWSRK